MLGAKGVPSLQEYAAKAIACSLVHDIKGVPCTSRDLAANFARNRETVATIQGTHNNEVISTLGNYLSECVSIPYYQVHELWLPLMNLRTFTYGPNGNLVLGSDSTDETVPAWDLRSGTQEKLENHNDKLPEYLALTVCRERCIANDIKRAQGLSIGGSV